MVVHGAEEAVHRGRDDTSRDGVAAQDPLHRPLSREDEGSPACPMLCILSYVNSQTVQAAHFISNVILSVNPRFPSR